MLSSTMFLTGCLTADFCFHRLLVRGRFLTVGTDPRRGRQMWLSSFPPVRYVLFVSSPRNTLMSNVHQVVGVDITPHMKQDDTPENFEAQASHPFRLGLKHVELQLLLLVCFSVVDLQGKSHLACRCIGRSLRTCSIHSMQTLRLWGGGWLHLSPFTSSNHDDFFPCPHC